MKMFKAISIVGLVVLAAVACSAQLTSIERSKLAKENEFFQGLAQKYMQKASSQTADAPYWAVAAQIVSGIDTTRQYIIGSALGTRPEAELPDFFENANVVNEYQVSSLQMLLRFGQMNTPELRGEIEQIQGVIRRQPGQGQQI